MTALKKSFVRRLPLRITAGIFAVLFGGVSLTYDGFFSLRIVNGLLADNAFLGIAAVGMTLVMFCGGIDLSVGAVIGFTSMFVAMLVGRGNLPPLVAWAVGTALGAGMGALIHMFRLPAFLITLAGMFLARGAAFWLNTDSIPIAHAHYDWLSGFEMPGLPGLNAIALLMLAMLGFGYVLGHHTRFGRNLLAIGGSGQSAVLTGAPVGASKIAAYAFSGFCAALAGIVATVYTGSGNPSMGLGLELDVIAIVVIGGTLLTGAAAMFWARCLASSFSERFRRPCYSTAVSARGGSASRWERCCSGSSSSNECSCSRHQERVAHC